MDLNGVLYIADGVHIRKVVSGQIQTVAGDGYLHAIGDGGLATDALLSQPSAIALNGAGSLYIADTGTQRVRQVLPTGVIQTLAGTGVAGYVSDNVGASAAMLNLPMGVAVDAAGNILIADTWNQRIRQVAADGLIRTLVGTGAGGVGAEGLPPAQTPLSDPGGVCIDRGGTLFVVDTFNHRVLRSRAASPGGDRRGQRRPGRCRRWRTGAPGAAQSAQRLRPRFRRQPLHRRHLEPPHPQSGPFRHDLHGGGHRRGRLLRRRRPRHRRQPLRSARRGGGR